MARRGGFFAEMQRISAQAERDRQRAAAANYRDQQRLQRERAAAERAYERASRADEREYKRLHIEAREAEVASMNADLIMQLADIDNILIATLAVDDYVDLEMLRQSAQHPPFESKYSIPIPQPAPIQAPPQPELQVPTKPSALGGVFGGKKKYEEQLAAAQSTLAERMAEWDTQVAAIPMQQLAQLTEHAKAEQDRHERLAADRAQYDLECAQREAAVAAENGALDALINGLAQGRSESVEEYVGIVFGNSLYPEGLEPNYDYEFDAATRELTVTLELPTPDQVSNIASYRYVKASDEITEKPQTQKDQKERYANLVNAVALRTMHEIWESDRANLIDSISLTAGVHAISTATGVMEYVPLLAAAVDRMTFDSIDLSNVVPADTLKHFNAVLSKNPIALTPISTGRGVRGH